MATKVAERMALSETYADVERLVYKTCWQFVERHGGEFDECLSIANGAYMEAYRTHTASRSRFSTWLRTCVWYALLNAERAESRRRERTVHDNGPLLDIVAENADGLKRLSTDGLLSELGDDAATVVRITLDAGRELAAMASFRKAPDHRSAICQYLHGVGWTMDRIAESFREIRGAIDLI